MGMSSVMRSVGGQNRILRIQCVHCIYLCNWVEAGDGAYSYLCYWRPLQSYFCFRLPDWPIFKTCNSWFWSSCSSVVLLSHTDVTVCWVLGSPKVGCNVCNKAITSAWSLKVCLKRMYMQSKLLLLLITCKEVSATHDLKWHNFLSQKSYLRTNPRFFILMTRNKYILEWHKGYNECSIIWEWCLQASNPVY